MKKMTSLRMDAVNLERVGQMAQALDKSQAEIIERAVELAYGIYSNAISEKEDADKQIQYETERFARDIRERAAVK